MVNIKNQIPNPCKPLKSINKRNKSIDKDKHIMVSSPHTLVIDTTRSDKIQKKKSPKSPKKKQPKIQKNKKIEHIVLDLDETLIYAIETSDLKNPQLDDYYKKNIHKFKHHNLDNDYIITERPGLQDFLDFLFENYKVSVWTAASKDYGIFVIKNVITTKPERKLEIQMFSEHCNASKEKTGCLKQLNQLWSYAQFNPSNTLIIDDNKNVISKQNNIVIPAKPFNFFNKNSDTDNFLLNVKNKIIKMT